MYKPLLIICTVLGFSGCDDPEYLAKHELDEQTELDDLADNEQGATRDASPIGEITNGPRVTKSTNPGGCSGPSRCYWAVGGGIPGAGTWNYAAVCDSAGFSVVSGACDKALSTTTVTRSMPFENNISNVPENECFDGLTADSGWTCSFNQPTGPGGVQVYALCCN